MTTLIVTLGDDATTRKHVEGVVSGQEWATVIYVQYDSVSVISKKDTITVSEKLYLQQAIESISEQLPKISDTDVAVNFISGPGKLHMAVISALLQKGLGIRLVALTPEGVKEV